VHFRHSEIVDTRQMPAAKVERFKVPSRWREQRIVPLPDAWAPGRASERGHEEAAVKTHADESASIRHCLLDIPCEPDFLTSAAKRGASIFKMMDLSRHRSVDTLWGYVRDAEIFKAGLL
jgi:hypothetical protein